jgi:hypothetical protein
MQLKKSYIIVPTILMVGFGFIYKNFTVENAIKEEQEAIHRAEVVAAEEAQQAEGERRAKEDADRRTAEREADEAKTTAERRAKWAAAGQEIADDTAKYNSEANAFAKEVAEFEITLLETRNTHQALNTETFELMKKVENARIAKRTAELKEQRFVEMVANRAKESMMAQMPPPPPPVEPSK